MNDINEAKEIGLRCRRLRMAKGMSQEQLAEKLNTVPQTISKYENIGVTNIETIRRLSEVLGHNLLTSERDTEGVIGEIGKHILNQLVKAGGMLEVEDLTEQHMYGMNSSLVSNEIYKLERIGVCVREQYENVVKDEFDTLFLTAKGAIVYNNFHPENPIGDINTYEELTKEEVGRFLTNGEVITYDSYAEYQKAQPAIELLSNLYKVDNYREDFILYVDRKYNQPNTKFKINKNTSLGVSCVCDIIYKMALGLGKSGNSNYYDLFSDQVMHYNKWHRELKREEELRKIIAPDGGSENPVDIAIRNAANGLFDYSSQNEVYINDDINYPPFFDRYIKIKDTDSDEITKAKMELKELMGFDDSGSVTFDDSDEIDDYESYYLERFTIPRLENLLETKSQNPTEWFSLDEIKAWVEENIEAAITEEEHFLDDYINAILRKMDDTRNYYKFPKSWEDHGIADIIRERYNISF